MIPLPISTICKRLPYVCARFISEAPITIRIKSSPFLNPFVAKMSSSSGFRKQVMKKSDWMPVEPGWIEHLEANLFPEDANKSMYYNT